MNAKQIAAIFEVLFSDYPEEGGSKPGNSRFQWVDPKTGKKPPMPPKSVLPTEKDLQELDPQFSSPEPSQAMPDDRTGSIPMSQMIPKSEVATIDDLLDQYMRIKDQRGEQAAREWFDMYRSAEFESAVQKLVGVFLAS